MICSRPDQCSNPRWCEAKEECQRDLEANGWVSPCGNVGVFWANVDGGGWFVADGRQDDQSDRAVFGWGYPSRAAAIERAERYLREEAAARFPEPCPDCTGYVHPGQCAQWAVEAKRAIAAQHAVDIGGLAK